LTRREDGSHSRSTTSQGWCRPRSQVWLRSPAAPASALRRSPRCSARRSRPRRRPRARMDLDMGKRRHPRAGSVRASADGSTSCSAALRPVPSCRAYDQGLARGVTKCMPCDDGRVASATCSASPATGRCASPRVEMDGARNGWIAVSRSYTRPTGRPGPAGSPAARPPGRSPRWRRRVSCSVVTPVSLGGFYLVRTSILSVRAGLMKWLAMGSALACLVPPGEAGEVPEGRRSWLQSCCRP